MRPPPAHRDRSTPGSPSPKGSIDWPSWPPIQPLTRYWENGFPTRSLRPADRRPCRRHERMTAARNSSVEVGDFAEADVDDHGSDAAAIGVSSFLRVARVREI